MIQYASIADAADVNPRLPRDLASERNRKVSFVPMANVSEDGFIEQEDERLLGDVVKGYTYFRRGDVLLAKITPCVQNGKAAHAAALRHEIGFGTTEFHVLRPKPDTDGRYLFYMIWNPVFRYVAERNMTGSAGQKRVPTDFVKRFQIPFPPLADQKRIAAILDQADVIRHLRRRAIETLPSLRLSMFYRSFHERSRLARGADIGLGGSAGRHNPGWSSSRLSSGGTVSARCECLSGPTGIGRDQDRTRNSS
jgi:type I restriction enzyme S subunit